MDWSDQPAGQPATFSPPPAAAPVTGSPSASPILGGARRLIATTVLAVGLLGIGGAAVVLAADPSATPAPSATAPSGSGGTGGSGGTTTPGTRPNGLGHAKGDCPNMGGSGSGSGGSTAPSTTPSTDNPTTAPSADL